MTTIVILAAGSSLRLGKPKQTLPYKGQTLLKNTIRAAVDSAVGEVVVVIGANKNDIFEHIKDEPVTILINEIFAEGMSSSIIMAVNYLSNQAGVDQIILSVCDQPYINKDIFEVLVKKKAVSKASIIACNYKGNLGVPALFDKIHFAELLQLKGDEGGKKVLLKHQNFLAVIPFFNGEVDIDTIDDYNALIK